MKLSELNTLERPEWLKSLGGIFEHSPWVAAAVFEQRPFPSVDALHDAMCGVVLDAPADQRLALIRAHPQLASKAAVRGELTAASNQEQSGAGLTECTPEQFAHLNELNAAYNAKFGFPFILAVRGHTRESVIAEMERRLVNQVEDEFVEALRQIERIALLRLHALLGHSDG
ncbi:2-oxo-4-hydroxy-4-carboxy-5-ureidoimidazoline decarboxylase [Pseudomarimonas arenosa]|uniref:2-oxo-4-hydroxy-4-carboxy-5-ureidoimidazoline decarboxylase n=1 Tax=Pseudomarimonas arenosa TaxID=2774145 RepID=A0AAW3ZIR1_9GAMM|nr:2-oxo-4-hydroxy-4-carboxy-5-ureidoimidazoline decarboxylase [Pseudomarimonas arenosa]MBD8525668.1 2-oxo-4-hydroxy-4-carboxy-5-ureidoimidazoline decarboxylase [Pseudomarimonas arenosa]